MISETMGKYPQESYNAVVRAIQSECIFLQRVTMDTGDAVAGVEKIIPETFLPLILFGKTKSLLPIVRDLSAMTVNKSVLALLNPVMSTNDKYLSSQRESAELIRDVTGGGSLSNTDHLQELRGKRYDVNKNRDDSNDAKLKCLVGDLIGTYRLILRAKKTGASMNV